MAPSNKSKAAGVSASSFLDLKAELAKQESDFAKQKATGKSSYIVGGIQRPDKKPTVWARTNKGVSGRNARDLEQDILDRPTVESTRAALERKAKIYEKLKKGKTAGLSEAQYDMLLVDFDTKDAMDHYSSDSDDVDESLTVPKPGPASDDEDPIIEYEDEFGRVRTARRSEVPRNFWPTDDISKPMDDDPLAIHNPVDYFPVYEPSDDRKAAVEASLLESNNPLSSHYDASKEVRSKGGAFYSFSKDEELRNKEMQELKKAREETERARKDTGAVDLKPGDVEGMIPEEGNAEAGPSSIPTRSRAMEKRKREIEERRKLLEAKRKKVKPDPNLENLADQPVKEVVPAGEDHSISESAAAPQTTKPSPSKRKQKVKTPPSKPNPSAADDFLARLEIDLQKKG